MLGGTQRWVQAVASFAYPGNSVVRKRGNAQLASLALTRVLDKLRALTAKPELTHRRVQAVVSFV